MRFHWRRRGIPAVVWVALIVGPVLFAFAADGGKYSLVAPNGLRFDAVKGYEGWELVSSHYRTDKDEIRFIFGNKKIVDAYKAGAGKDGKAFPDGAILVKVGYSTRKNPDFDKSVEPDVMQRVEFMLKDAKRFSETGGWGFARFVYDSASGKFSPYGDDKEFASECFSCHTIVKHKGFVFTDYSYK